MGAKNAKLKKSTSNIETTSKPMELVNLDKHVEKVAPLNIVMLEIETFNELKNYENSEIGLQFINDIDNVKTSEEYMNNRKENGEGAYTGDDSENSSPFVSVAEPSPSDTNDAHAKFKVRFSDKISVIRNSQNIVEQCSINYSSAADHKIQRIENKLEKRRLSFK
jgi:hypothetical protein